MCPGTLLRVLGLEHGLNDKFVKLVPWRGAAALQLNPVALPQGAVPGV